MTTATQDLDDRCKHDLSRRTCGLCNGVAERFRREHDLEVERVLALSGWFPARYAGRCAGCGEWFPVNTPIRRKTNLDRFARTSQFAAMCCAPSKEEDADA